MISDELKLYTKIIEIDETYNFIIYNFIYTEIYLAYFLSTVHNKHSAEVSLFYLFLLYVKIYMSFQNKVAKYFYG
jgi:hypothetical protein